MTSKMLNGPDDDDRNSNTEFDEGKEVNELQILCNAAIIFQKKAPRNTKRKSFLTTIGIGQ